MLVYIILYMFVIMILIIVYRIFDKLSFKNNKLYLFELDHDDKNKAKNTYVFKKNKILISFDKNIKFNIFVENKSYCILEDNQIITKNIGESFSVANGTYTFKIGKESDIDNFNDIKKIKITSKNLIILKVVLVLIAAMIGTAFYFLYTMV